VLWAYPSAGFNLGAGDRGVKVGFGCAHALMLAERRGLSSFLPQPDMRQAGAVSALSTFGACAVSRYGGADSAALPGRLDMRQGAAVSAVLSWPSKRVRRGGQGRACNEGFPS
jgi:hypothetical protein